MRRVGVVMRYVSLFSGIEAATVAWEPLGWEPMCFCEVEPFPCEVLKKHYPSVPNLGDVTKVDWRGFRNANGRPDLLVGGSPCQSFSIAGGRESLDGESRLMFEWLRAVDELRPRWVVWENVPGALSAKGIEGERGALSSACSESWLNSGMAFAGEFLTLSSSEWPSAADVCFLSDALETSEVPQRYYLSPTACQGILSRAERRGKLLPSQLDAALRAQAGLSSSATREATRGGAE